jgi:hypothetical protein
MALTYYGDANLDFKVNALDFNALASHFGQSSRFWSDGDFDFNGTVNSLDFNALASNFNQVLSLPAPAVDGAAALGTNVPEPATLAAIAALGLLCRRRTARSRI